MRRRKFSTLGESIIDRLRWRFLTSDIDLLGGAGGETEPAPVETPDVPAGDGGAPVADRPDFNAPNASEPAGSTPGQPQPRSQPADPNQRAGVTQPQAAAPAGDWQSIRDAAVALGYQAPANITGDREFLVHLLQQAQAAKSSDYYAQLGRSLAPQAPAVLNYLQQQRLQAAQPQAPKPWEAPEFDERWAGLVEKDERTGMFVAKQGVPHEIAQKVNNFVEWKTKFDRNPAAVMNAMVDERAKAIAHETFRDQFAAAQRESAIGGIIQANTPWLYQTDAAGQRVMNPVTGQPAYTPVGAMYVQQLQALRQAGVTDPARQDALAKQLVRGQYAAAQAQRAAADANPQTQQALARPNTNPLQALPPTQRRVTPGATEPSAAGQTLADMLREGMRAEGVTDADIMASVEN